jgi:hypothetical protein
MKIVILESPFKPSDDAVAHYRGQYSRAELLRQNLVYARLCLLNALGRGESPLASHLLYTQVWDESNDLREAGIKAGIELYQRADLSALYVDLGVSDGMKEGQAHAQLIGVETTRRLLFATHEDGVRANLHERSLAGFPYLDELLAKENTTRNGNVGTSR